MAVVDESLGHPDFASGWGKHLRTWLGLQRTLLIMFFGSCVLLATGGTAWALFHHYSVPRDGWIISLTWLAAVSIAYPILRSERPVPWIWVACTVVLLGRLAALMLTQGALPRSGDPLIYDEIANNLLSGQGLVWRPGGSWGDLRALFPPLYPLLLSGAKAISGESPLAAFFLNALFDGAAAWMIVLIARQFGEERAGAVAAYLYLIWPSVLLGAAFPQKESLAVFLVLAQTAVLASIWRKRELTPKSCALFGAFNGLLALTQPALTLLAGLLVIFSLPVIKLAGAVRLAALSLPFFTAVLLPWWIRNWIVLGDFVPLTTAAGFTFYFDTLQVTTVPAAAVNLPEAERMSFLAGVAAEWVASHPFEFLLNKAKAAAQMLSLEHAGVELLKGLETRPAVSAESVSVASQFSLIILWAQALLAAMFGRSALLSNRFFVSILIAFLIQLFLFNFWFTFAQRHRLPLDPLIMLWSMIVLSERLGNRRDRSSSPAA